jgi:hypothetical protein
MKRQEVKQGVKVSDIWYGDWGFGIIESVKKTQFIVNFSIQGRVTFDYPHAQFLKIENNGKP